MLPYLNSHYLFIVTNPVCAPGTDRSSLCAVSYFLTDAAYNIVSDFQQLRCKRADFILPSPNYLFTQKIDPSFTDKGLSELEFYSQIEKLLLTPNLKVFTWSVRNLSILESIAIRTLQDKYVLDNVQNITDVNKVLKTHELFDTGSCNNSDNLLVCAKNLGFVQDNADCDYKVKLKALLFLVQELEKRNPALLKYYLQDKSQKADEVKEAIVKNDFLVNYNSKHHCLDILKPVFTDDKDILSHYYDGNNVCSQYYSFNDSHLLAPIKVLTKQRQDLLGIDVVDIKQIISNNLVNVEFKPIGLYRNRLNNLTKSDLAFYNECISVNKLRIDEAPLSCSHDFREFILKFRGNNFKGSLIDIELKEYYKVCIKELKKQVKGYTNELNTLIHMLDEKDEKATNLINSLVKFINEL